ncbi:MAG: alkaline phosphatase [Comamonadaceae bacterium]|nr:MAG: alkaline phosphatase [Comamonadaceae bacterium]
MRSNSRRDFIIRVASVSATLAAGGAMADEAEEGFETASAARRDGPVRFDHGVASGDPLSDRVVLWTHARRRFTNLPVVMRWEVARDPGFRHLVSAGWVTARAENGFTAKVDARGLKAGRSYYYRFRTLFDVSPVGMTRTLPAAGVHSVKLAVFSCANYPAGFFHAYGEAVRAGAEYALHLGDYIYEYPADGYASEDAEALGRLSTPANEILTLADYRARYAQYRSDPDLKQLHASMPMIAVWDDHEITNDAYVSGAENHTEGTGEGGEGAFRTRLATALKVYHEWMPIRTPDLRDLRKIYRSFDFGGLVSLHMLETRVLARERQVQVGDLINPATAPTAIATLASPTRQLLGSEQMAWLTRQMTASRATWQVLGQQVLMGRMEFPASILQVLNPADTSPEAQAAAARAINDYLVAKATAAQAPQLLTPQQQALLNPQLNPKLGYNLDAWDGYPAARELLLGTAAALGKRVVVLAGDTHNAWHNDLTLLNGTKVGEEFATPGVSSPGLEEYLVTLPPVQTAAIFRGVIDTLNYAETARRGFLLMTFTAEAAVGEWYLLDTVKSTGYAVSMDHSATLIA